MLEISNPFYQEVRNYSLRPLMDKKWPYYTSIALTSLAGGAAASVAKMTLWNVTLGCMAGAVISLIAIIAFRALYYCYRERIYQNYSNNNVEGHFDQLKKAADMGHLKAQVEMACKKGNEDPKEALKYFQLALNQGYNYENDIQKVLPLLKFGVELSAKEVSIDDPYRWILNMSDKERFFLILIQATIGLSPSFKENFLRKLAMQHQGSTTLLSVFKKTISAEFKVEEIINPKSWTLLTQDVKDHIFSHLTFANILTCQSRVDSKSYIAVRIYSSQMHNRIRGFEEFALGGILERYCNLLTLTLKELKPDQGVKNLFEYLLHANLKKFNINRDLGIQIINSFFENASDEQIYYFYIEYIANKGYFFPSFSQDLTKEKLEKLFNFLLQRVTSELEIKYCLFTLAKLEYLWAKNENADGMKLNMREFLFHWFNSIYEKHKTLQLWGSIRLNRDSSNESEILSRHLARIKICELLDGLDIKNDNEIPLYTTQLTFLFEAISYGHAGWKAQEDHLYQIFEFICKSTFDLNKRSSQLHLLATIFMGKDSLWTLITIAYDCSEQNNSMFVYEMLFNLSVEIHERAGKYFNFSHYTRHFTPNTLNLAIKKCNAFKEPMRSFQLANIAMRIQTYCHEEDYFDPRNVLEEYFKNHKLNLNDYLKLDPSLFRQECSKFATGQELTQFFEYYEQDKRTNSLSSIKTAKIIYQ